MNNIDFYYFVCPGKIENINLVELLNWKEGYVHYN